MSEIMDLSASDRFEELPEASQTFYLTGLNKGQYDAVTASEKGGLQVLGTPGCGKTKTLTSRVAHLVKEYRLDPARIVVVTFTNKAANEMKTRLRKTIGDELTDKLVMGTFHSVCAQHLRRYGSLVSLANNFSILDRDDSASVIKRVTDSYPNFPSKTIFKGVKPSAILNKISFAKSKKLNPESYKINVKINANQHEREWISIIWTDYQAQLEKTNAVDFDDLLIKGHELFKNHPHTVERIQTVLVDELQDTSVTQYEIAKFIAKPSGSMTVVGDPDQSIYGWRNADVENLENMVKEFKGCRQIFLEQNYRSTNSILQAALGVIQQDKKRIKKSLYSSHPTGTPVVLHKSNDGDEEASYIAQTIQNLKTGLNGLVENDDFAILLRAGYQSLSIELALQKAGIPSVFRGGHKFFERVEVKDILSYLQLIANPHHTAALERVLNVPKRSLGDKASKQIFAEVDETGMTAWQVLTIVADGGASGLSLSAQAKKGVKGLVEIIRSCRRKAVKLSTVGQLIALVVDQTGYKAYLDKTYKGSADDRMLNIQELKNYAVIVAKESGVQEIKEGSPDIEFLDAPPQASTSAATQEVKEEEGGPRRSARGTKAVEKKVVKGKEKTKAKAKGKGKKKVKDEDYEDEEEEEDGPDLSDDPSNSLNVQLQAFLSAASLATDVDTQEAEKDVKVKKVVLSTVHSAKGLEWPVVFIPAVENGSFPFYLASKEEEIDEERRLLYVAITRAQALLVLSHAKQRMGGGTIRSKSLSSFVDTLPKGTFATKLPAVNNAIRAEVAKVLGRAITNVKSPESDDIEIVETFDYHAGPSNSDNKRQSSSSSNQPIKKVKY